MLSEFIKILADEPEKLVKVVIRIYRVLLTGLFGVFLYRFFLHIPPEFDIEKTDKLIDFILKGNFIVFCLFYAISYFILFVLASTFFSYVAFWTAQWVDIKPSTKDLQMFLAGAGALSLDKNSKTLKPGRNFEVFHELFKEYGKKETMEEMTSLKGSYIDNIWSLGCVSAFVFFISGAYRYWSPGLIWMILLVLFLLLLLFWGIVGLLEYLKKYHLLLNTGFSAIKSFDIIKRTVEGQGIKLDNTNENPWGVITFNLNKRQYIFHLLFVDQEFLLEKIRDHVAANRHQDRFFLFISNMPIQGSITPLDLIDFDIRIFENEEDLERKVLDFLKIHSRKTEKNIE